jgi:hypothetical protein
MNGKRVLYKAIFCLCWHVLLEVRPVFSLFVFGLFLVVVSCDVLSLQLFLLFWTNHSTLASNRKQPHSKTLSSKTWLEAIFISKMVYAKLERINYV